MITITIANSKVIRDDFEAVHPCKTPLMVSYNVYGIYISCDFEMKMCSPGSIRALVMLIMISCLGGMSMVIPAGAGIGGAVAGGFVGNIKNIKLPTIQFMIHACKL